MATVVVASGSDHRGMGDGDDHRAVVILLVALMAMVVKVVAVIHVYTHRCSRQTCNFCRRSKVAQRCTALAEIANTRPGVSPIRIIHEYVNTQRHTLRNLCVCLCVWGGSHHRRRSPLTKVLMLQCTLHGYVGREHDDNNEQEY